MKTKTTIKAIQDKETKKFLTQAAYEIWADGHNLDGLDMWTDDIDQAAWIADDELPSGLNRNRFAVVEAL